ncbi:MAG: carboxylating nicotinate-nucleotide diphosphorylase [Nitrospiraceae bacterium]
MNPLPRLPIRTAVRTALQEDAAWGDVTTAALLIFPTQSRATIVARQSMTLAGIAVAREVLAEVDPDIRIVNALDDGLTAKAGTIVLTAEGDGRSLLIAERVALNFLQRLSGIATLTARFCATVRGYRTRILDTRKTTPGLRSLEKWAVRLGGGLNHRQSLGDGILIKDNHLALLKGQRISLAQACRLARDRGPHGLRVMVEAQSLNQVDEALQGEADVILLDNMTPAQIRQAVARIKGRALVEVSGGITLERARDMAAAGADYLSIGALTHSAPAVDLSMDIMPLKRRPIRTRA